LGLNLEHFLLHSDGAFDYNKSDSVELVPCYKHRDHKLRGFGGATRVISGNSLEEKSEYRLVCGLGIKNLHVWSFVSPPNQLSNAAEWSCIYDIVTNGITIECAEFLNGGLEVMSKSAGANIRVSFLLL
jgi:hypothetical protein